MKRILMRLITIVFSLVLSSVAFGQTTQFRGVMISPQVQAGDLQTLGQTWNVNFIRWQLTWNNMPANATLEQYDQWLEGALTKLDSLLPVCGKNDIKVLVDLHTLPGGRNANNQNLLFTDPKCQAKFIQVWDKIVRRYSGNKTVWGYDLANEPIQGNIAIGLMDWHQLATQVAHKARLLDGTHYIVVEPDGWALPDGFTGFSPLPSSITNVVYSFHMYLPHKFTHQGVDAYSSKTLRYPGSVDGIMWDKSQLRRSMQPVVDFQKKYGVRILVGEFSAVRWAPSGSAYNYLKDAIGIFEENGWDWTYHAFREWSGWSVEHTEDKNNTNPSPKQTNREKLLRSWFNRNR